MIEQTARDHGTIYNVEACTITDYCLNGEMPTNNAAKQTYKGYHESVIILVGAQMLYSNFDFLSSCSPLLLDRPAGCGCCPAPVAGPVRRSYGRCSRRLTALTSESATLSLSSRPLPPPPHSAGGRACITSANRSAGRPEHPGRRPPPPTRRGTYGMLSLFPNQRECRRAMSGGSIARCG